MDYLIAFPIIFLISFCVLLYCKNQQKKNFIVLGGCLMTIVTFLVVTSAICSILSFIFRYLI